MPRGRKATAATVSKTIAVLGGGTLDEKALNALLDDALEGVDEVTFVFPVTDEHFTEAIEGVLVYSGDVSPTIPYIAVTNASTNKDEDLSQVASEADQAKKNENVAEEILSILRDSGNGVIYAFNDPDDENSPQAELLMDVMEAFLDEDENNAAYDLCDGMDKIDLGDGEEPGPVEEPEEEPAPKENRVTRGRARDKVLAEEALESLQESTNKAAASVAARGKSAEDLSAVNAFIDFLVEQVVSRTTIGVAADEPDDAPEDNADDEPPAARRGRRGASAAKPAAKKADEDEEPSEASLIRTWAQKNNVTVSPRGRIAESVKTAYAKAMAKGDSAEPARRAGRRARR